MNRRKRVILLSKRRVSCIQLSFVTAALQQVLPWCMMGHFNTRLFAQATLLSLWQQCSDKLQHSVAIGDSQSVYSTVHAFVTTNRLGGQQRPRLSN